MGLFLIYHQLTKSNQQTFMAHLADSQHDDSVPKPTSTVSNDAARGLDGSVPPVSDGRLNAEKLDAPNHNSGFGRLARNISSRTTDLLAIAMVLLVGFTVGGQVSHWWANDTGDLGLQISSAAGTAPPLGETPVVLEFGDSPHTISREVVSGRREQMIARLTDLCAAVVANKHSRPVPAHPAEKRLLDVTQQLEPIREKSNEWEVYAVDLQLTLIIGVRYFHQQSGSTQNSVASRTSSADQSLESGEIEGWLESERSLRSAAPSAAKSGGSLRSTPATLSAKFAQYEAEFAAANGTPKMAAGNGRRMVCWGFGFPSGEQKWTLYLVQSTERIDEELPGLPQIALPDGSRRVLRLREASGGGLTAFAGEGRPEEWIRSFNGWFARHNWKETAAWEQSPNGWSASFVSSVGGTSSGRVDVSFCRVGEMGLSGIVSVTPPARK